MNKVSIIVSDTSSLKNKNSLTEMNNQNGNATQQNNTQPNNKKLTLTREIKVNLSSLNGIINGEKTNLPSRRTIEKKHKRKRIFTSLS